jgi:hypothetical protein
MDQQPSQQRQDRRHGNGGAPTRTMCTQPLPLPQLRSARAPRPAPGPGRRFAIAFLTVLGHYALGVCTFSVMAAANVPGGGDVPQMVWHAVENTSLIAVAVALAAGCWWV